ncbi:MAG: hypothetical protein ACK5L3_02340 [Oscillospiraceae bacterium]
MQFESKPTRQDFVEFGIFTGLRRHTRGGRSYAARNLLGYLCSVLLLVWMKLRFKPPFWFSVFIYMLIGMLLLVIVGFFLQPRAIRKNYAALYEKNNLPSQVVLNEKGISTCAQDGSQSLFYAWRRIEFFAESEHLYVFTTRSGIGIFFNKACIQNEVLLKQLVAMYLPLQTAA